MRVLRRVRSALAPEAAELLTCLLVFGVAFGAWRAIAPTGGQAQALAAARWEAPAEGFEPSEKETVITASKIAGPLTPTSSTADPGLNVVLITVDTLRWDLGFAGYPRPVSPRLDALAKRSVVYEHAYATASYTMMCLVALLTGRYPSEAARDYQHYTNFFASNVFLAERVRAAGDHTIAGTTHHYFRAARKKGFEQGFDVWDTSAIPVTTLDNETAVTSDLLSDAAIARLDGPHGGGSPSGHFFAWFHYLDPHAPYVPHEGSPKFASSPSIPPERAAYDAEVWFTDQQIGRVLDHIASQPWGKETAIIVTADHGEAFGERGHWNHGRELWEPLVRVPLVVFVPGTTPRRIAVKRSHIDIVPTVLDLMAISPPASDDPKALRGQSLLADIAALTAGRVPEERDVYFDMPEGQLTETRRGILTGPSPGLKLVDRGTGVGSARYELFDLANDPNETKNLAATEPARLREASHALHRLRAGLQEIPAVK